VNKRKKQTKGKTKGKPENIALKAHNPGIGNPINIAHNTPLVVEKPNIEQANKVNSLKEDIYNQNKTLQEDRATIGKLIDDEKEFQNVLYENDIKLNYLNKELKNIKNQNKYLDAKSIKQIEDIKAKNIIRELGNSKKPLSEAKNNSLIKARAVRKANLEEAKQKKQEELEEKQDEEQLSKTSNLVAQSGDNLEDIYKDNNTLTSLFVPSKHKFLPFGEPNPVNPSKSMYITEDQNDTPINSPSSTENIMSFATNPILNPLTVPVKRGRGRPPSIK
jgi:hypothetical protein